MAYSDATFNASSQHTVVGGVNTPITLGTCSGAGTATNTYLQTNTGTALNGCFILPKFIDATMVRNVRVYALGAASGGGVSGLTIWFATLNSTNTATVTNTYGTYTFTGVNTPFAQVPIGTSSIGQTYDAVMSTNVVASNGAITNPAWFGTAISPITVVTHTQTATASVLGSYAVDFQTRNLFQS